MEIDWGKGYLFWYKFSGTVTVPILRKLSNVTIVTNVTFVTLASKAELFSLEI